VRYILLLLLFCGSVRAQTSLPGWGPAFPQNEVASIYITIDPDSLDALLSNEFLGGREFPASFVFHSTGLNDTVGLIGFRARGNTSLGANKKSFQVSFNAFSSGGQWNELEKLNLVGSHNDPSMIRAKLCWDAIREAGFPGSRSSFINLYINNENRGVYTNNEHIDEEFAKKYYDNFGDGNLYKCLYPATLQYNGPNGSDYKAFSGDNRIYDLQINEWADDYSDLAEFITTLNQTPINDLACELDKIFNTDQYLHYAALDVLTGNWDNYIYNKNNFYLYHNQQTGLIEYLPYDLDNTLGIDWVGQNWTTRNIYNWAPSAEERPLFKRLMQVPEYRDRYSFLIRHYSATVLLPSHVSSRAQSYITMLTPAASLDPYRSLDYGFSMDDFTNSLDEAAGGHVEQGIVTYLEQRIENALSQADESNGTPSIFGSWLDSDFPFVNNGSIYLSVENADSFEVQWRHSTDGTNWSAALPMSDDGTGEDEIENDGIYSADLQFTGADPFVFYQFNISESGNIIRTYPCAPKTLFLTKAAPGLFINELMSDNESVIDDEENKYEDWIELWNGGNAAISLKGKFLTDDPGNPNKWPLPNVNISAGGFRFFWADSDEEDGQFHCNFSLSANGEELRLYQQEQGTLRLVDNITFPALNADNSWGRGADGSPDWINFSGSTPDASNSTSGVTSPDTGELLVYPNPTNGIVYFNRRVKLAHVYDITGRNITNATNCYSVNLEELGPGAYLLSLDGNFRKVIVKK